MLKKVLLLLLVVAAGLGLLLLTARGSQFAVQRSTVVADTPEQVWSLLADIGHWKSWWPGMEDAQLLGPLALGSRIRLQLKGLPESEPVMVEWLDPFRLIGWSGPGVLGSRVTTRVELRGTGEGTEVLVHNSILGPQAVLARFSSSDSFTQYQELILKTLARQLSLAAAAGPGGEKD